MTDQTIPTENPHIMPGVRDYQVDLPFERITMVDAREVRVVTVRLPAATAADAAALARGIGLHIQAANASSAGWKFDDQADLPVTDVDDTQAPSEVAAERDHWRRVVAALAAKFPMTLQLTADEYYAAAPDGLEAVPVGDGMLFAEASVMDALRESAQVANEPLLLPATEQLVLRPSMNLPDLDVLVDGRWRRLVEVTAEGAEAGHIVVVAYVPGRAPTRHQVPDDAALPVRNQQPMPHGGHEDPDVRRTRARRLRELTKAGAEVEMLAHGEWWRMVRAEMAPIAEGGEVHAYYRQDDAGGDNWVAFHPVELVMVRPATIEAYGSDLADPESLGKQLLTDTGWWTIDTAQDAGFASRSVNVRLSKGAETRSVAFPGDDPVLLRPRPPEGAWS